MNGLLQLVSVIAIIKVKNMYLLVKRHENDTIFPGKWQNVGGKVEPGETIEKALYREVAEEVTIKLSPDQDLLFVQSYAWKKSETDPVRLGLVFLINLDETPKNVHTNYELDSYGWFTLKEAKELDTISSNSPGGTIGQIKKSLSLEKKFFYNAKL